MTLDIQVLLPECRELFTEVFPRSVVRDDITVVFQRNQRKKRNTRRDVWIVFCKIVKQIDAQVSVSCVSYEIIVYDFCYSIFGLFELNRSSTIWAELRSTIVKVARYSCLKLLNARFKQAHIKG